MQATTMVDALPDQRHANPKQAPPSPSYLPLALLIAFLAVFALALVANVDRSPAPVALLLDPAFLFVATAVSIISMAQRLPLQNVLLAAALITIVTGLFELLKTVIGSGGLHGMSWSAPIIAFVIISNARGLGQLLLLPNRASRDYGFYLLSLTLSLATAFHLAFQLVAAHVKHYWLWKPHSLSSYDTPLLNLASFVLATFSALVVATPSLINKKPVRAPPNYSPVVIWACLSLFVAFPAMLALQWTSAVLALFLALPLPLAAVVRAGRKASAK
jgi:hypothetical protein